MITYKYSYTVITIDWERTWTQIGIDHDYELSMITYCVSAKYMQLLGKYLVTYKVDSRFGQKVFDTSL